MKKTLGIALLVLVALVGVAFAAEVGHIGTTPADFADAGDVAGKLPGASSLVDGGVQGAITTAEVDQLLKEMGAGVKLVVPHALKVAADGDLFVFGMSNVNQDQLKNATLFLRGTPPVKLARATKFPLGPNQWAFVNAAGQVVASEGPVYVAMNHAAKAGDVLQPVFALSAPKGGSSGGGCDAGLGGIALVALAGAFLAMRKK